ncbi:hypothetical protein H1Q63_16480 [Desmonostoc muscorum CCALA 125]|nr:hypothetical protein [Desmonostoc muscorum CCALA 125]
METTNRRQALIKAIYERLEQAYEDTLEDVIELLDIRKAEDEEDIKALHEGREDIKKNGTIPWEQVKQELQRSSGK